MYSSACASVLNIFQLPAIIGVRLMRGCAPAPWSACTPGSSRPSTSSSVAPPPVERWLTRSARPKRASAAAESPPPTTVMPGASATASATAQRAGRIGLELEGSHRAVPEHGSGAGDLARVQRRGGGADVQSHPSVGHVDAVEHAVLGLGA